MAEARANGFDFTFAKSDKKGSHFSTLKTMKEVFYDNYHTCRGTDDNVQWVERIFEPYRRQVIESDPDLNDDQCAIIYLDCYPVHTGQEFRSYVIQEFPHVILCFVPAGCKCHRSQQQHFISFMS